MVVTWNMTEETESDSHLGFGTLSTVMLCGKEKR